MAKNIETVAIVNKLNSLDAEETAKRIARILTSRRIKAYSVSALDIEGCESISPNELRNVNVDIVIAVGGDGTTLRSFRLMPSGTPLLNINVGGHRGILSEVTVDSIDDALDSILKGQYFYESRLRIQATMDNEVVPPPALNEIFCTRANMARTPMFSIGMMNDEIRQRMDGILISTPTGSTGHSLSFGSAILHEDLDCLILAPVASVNRMPPLVVPVQEIEIKCNHDLYLIVDGQEMFNVDTGKSVKISRYQSNAKFIRIKKRGMRQLAKLGF